VDALSVRVAKRVPINNPISYTPDGKASRGGVERKSSSRAFTLKSEGLRIIASTAYWDVGSSPVGV